MASVGERWRSPDGSMELRCGDYRDVLADVERCDAVITDPPYSPRVHEGQRTGSSTRKSTLDYASWTERDCDALAGAFDAWWFVVFSDHLAQRWHEQAAAAVGRYVFAPLPVIRECPTPRMSGDGPTSAAEYLTVSRPRVRLPADRMGSRPGYYVAPHANGLGYLQDRAVPGGKSIDLMRAIIRDYTRPGDLVVDPCAGGGTTLLAAAIEGRRAIGAEVDVRTFELAVRRLSRGYTATFPEMVG